MDKFIVELVSSNKTARPADLRRLIDHIAGASFSPALLVVDPPLWGGFWQFDVIAPGYALPVVELALLRAVRLDRTWPEKTTVGQFTADVRRAITDPRAGVWTLSLAGHPCVVIAGSDDHLLDCPQDRPMANEPAIALRTGHCPLATVGWYCASTGCLHAGYRAPIESLIWPQAVTQRELTASQNTVEIQVDFSWIEAVLKEGQNQGQTSQVHQLDREILRLRRRQQT